VQPLPVPGVPVQPQHPLQPVGLPQPGVGGGNTNPFNISGLINDIVQPIMGQPLTPNNGPHQPQPEQPGAGPAQPGQQPVLVDEVIDDNEEEGDVNEP
jgi:hypothetical protein